MTAFTDLFAREFENQAALVGRFNLAIFGKTGTGKSTLINAVFGHEVSEVGIGKPITQESRLFLEPRGTLGLIDTRGLEIGKDTKTIIKDVQKAVEQGRKTRPLDQIHAAWYCVRAGDRRFEETEAEFIKALAKLEIPVLLVLTQVPMRDGQYHPDAVTLAQHLESLRLPIVGGRPFLVNALRDPFVDQPEHGLMELLEATFRVIPEAIHAALAAAQQISMAAKARVAQAHIGASVAAAGTAAAVPIPVSAATVLVPIQLAMMARIAQIYQVPFDRAAILALATTGIATQTGRTAATALLKLLPGAGLVVGGVVNASVAGSFTFAMGQAWLAVCQKAAGGELPTLNGVLDSEAIKTMFRDELAHRIPGIKR